MESSKVNVEYYYRTIKELIDNAPAPFKDPYHFWDALGENKREAFINNITGCDLQEVCQIIGVVDGIAAGYLTLFTGYATINGEKTKVQHGSDLYVAPEYRKYMIGGEILLIARDLQKLPCIFAGFSSDARPLYPILGFKLFSYPRFVFFYKTRLIAESVLGLSGWRRNVIAFIGDCILFFYKVIIYIVGEYTMRHYTVVLAETVPSCIENMIDKHPYKYKELHNNDWFNYNLGYTFARNKEQALKNKKIYLIKNDNKILGFFLIRSSFQKTAVGKITMHNVYTAEVKEWDSYDYKALSETDIHFIITNFLRKENYDFITFPLFGNKSQSLFRKLFYKRTTFDVAVYMKGAKKKDDIYNEDNWRIRGGYSDTLID